MAAANHSHRAGRLRQTNKKNKRSAASKRSVHRRQGGKISGLPSAGGRKGPKSTDGIGGKAKATRANAAKQRREASRKTALNARRGLGAAVGGSNALQRALAAPPPRVVGIISLSELEGPLEERVRASLLGGADRILPSGGGARGHAVGAASVTAAYSVHAKGGLPHVTLLTNAAAFRPQYDPRYGEEDASVQAALDLCRICDAILFLIDGSAVASRAAFALGTSALGGGGGGQSVAGMSVKTSATTAHLDHLISERGERILAAVKAQGLPTPVTVGVHKTETMGEAGGAGSAAPVVGRRVGSMEADALDLEMEEDEDDEEEDEMEEDALASLPGTIGTHRSAKALRRADLRRRSELKRYAGRFAATEFGAAGKVAELEVAPDDFAVDGGKVEKMGNMDETTAAAATKASASAAALVRTLCTAAAAGPLWVADAPRPYLLADGTAASGEAVRYNEATRELEVTGYIRGSSPWNCHQLVHVPHLGTFAVKNIKLAGVSAGGDGKERLPPIIAAGRKTRKKAAEKNVDMGDADRTEAGDKEVILAQSDPEERESLEMFASPDALEGEQNLIGFDDDDDAHFDDESLGDGDDTKGAFQPGTARPAGWSDYQSAWLDALDADGEAEDRGELAFALNQKGAPDDSDAMMEEDKLDAEVHADEKRALLAARKKDREDDLQFPDEVDHEEEGAARERYARYRALASFRKGHWDPKENLPESYGAVYHFGSFRATQRDVLGEARGLEEVVRRRGWGVNVGSGAKTGEDSAMEGDSDDDEEEAAARACVPPGAYVTLTLEGVPPAAYARLAPRALVAAVSLLPHENKMSVLHAGLSPASGADRDDDVPVKSKDVLTFRCGWRTWQSRPIFSQLNLNSDKHKFERYLPARGGSHFAATVFGPATYAPCPVLAFRESAGAEDGEGKREFLAHGSMLGADADRIVLKRIVLTGYPTRVHKRHATVKYMFYNPDDVRWFMPAGISTKHGLRGNIVQSVGEHGVMKCLFNAPIKQHDTVCLPLYKRVYPKFAPPVEGEEEEGESGKQHFQVL
ncbi:hypothetical protein ACHAXT_011767 [Thalassiosira profunda]